MPELPGDRPEPSTAASDERDVGGYRAALRAAAHAAERFLADVEQRRVAPAADEGRARSADPLPEEGRPAVAVVEALVERMDPLVVASNGPRYFGFVTGGAHPAALAADWLVSTWDQNGALAVMSPGAAALEEEAGRWMLGLLGLPADAGFAFVTGATMANFTGLATARHHLLHRAGWDLERDGLQGAPALRVLVGEERHATVDLALRYLGIGTSAIVALPVDGQGRLRPDGLASALADGDVPTIVCAQAGNVNTGACDPLEAIAGHSSSAGAWLHVDGAFGLWAAASRRHRTAVKGVELADSWVTDAHKWLNVPYDCGFVATRHPDSQRAAMGTAAPYLATGAGRDGMAWGPEFSRRARGLTVWAVLQALGRAGVEDLVDRSCALARRLAGALAANGLEIANEVALNQVLVRFASTDVDDATADDLRTTALVRAVQGDGTCWAGGTVWRGRAAMRVSVSGWSTSEADIDRSVEAIVRAADAVRSAGSPGPA